jgi:hypothetical protein
MEERRSYKEKKTKKKGSEQRFYPYTKTLFKKKSESIR